MVFITVIQSKVTNQIPCKEILGSYSINLCQWSLSCNGEAIVLEMPEQWDIKPRKTSCMRWNQPPPKKLYVLQVAEIGMVLRTWPQDFGTKIIPSQAPDTRCGISGMVVFPAGPCFGIFFLLCPALLFWNDNVFYTALYYKRK